jgi:hypothetical protein
MQVIRNEHEEKNMKIAATPPQVLSSHNVGQHAQFQILANAHSFRILSSGLYSDKISAVLREVGCNAADAHIAAGIADRPIEVKIPSRLDSEFYIKDWGTGLSHEDILGLYTTYFSSNKGGNNLQTGAFGLGSKSPFSYTDSFAVTSVHEGIQTSYTAYIGPEGSPVISQLLSQPASEDWPQGIKVSFPVSPDDLTEFENKANTVFKWFAVKPVGPGESVSRFKDFGFNFEHSNFGFQTSAGPQLHNRGYSHRSIEEARVLTGNVAYPLDADRLGSESPLVKALIGAGIHLRMPLGTVMPTASREELEYDDRTRKNLVRALLAAGVELAMLLCAKVHEPANGEWERRQRARQFLELLPRGIGHDLAVILKVLDIDAKEQELIKDHYTSYTKKFPTWIGADVAAAGGAAAKILIDEANTFAVWILEEHIPTRRGRQSLGVRRYSIHNGRTKRGKFHEDAVVSYSSRVQVIYADGKHAYQRIKQYQASGAVDTVVMVAPAYEAGQAGLVAHAQKIAEELGGIQLVAASTLPLEVAGRVVVKRPKAKALKPADRARVYAEEAVRYVDATQAHLIERDTPFKDIPDNACFYLTAPVGRNPASYGVNDSKHPSRLVQEDHIEAIVRAFRTLRAQGIPVTDIGGYVFPVGPQARKFKLKEKGWKSLLETIVAELAQPEILAAIGEKLSDLPYLGFDRSGRKYLAGDAGLLGRLAEGADGNSEFRDWLLALVAELPALAELFNPLWDANVLTGSNRTTDMALQTFKRSNLVESEVFQEKAMDTDTFCEAVLARYPETRFISEDFVDVWSESHAGAEALLRLIFNKR